MTKRIPWKLADTIRICVTLFMARMFGRYVHSVWDGQRDYARYVWRGQEWAFPTSPLTARKEGQGGGA